jgi:hypothetical protein
MSHEKELQPHEWMAVCGLLLFIAVLIKFAWNAPDSRWPQRAGVKVSAPKEMVVVNIRGEVMQAGRYHYEAGTTLGEALKKVELKPDADVSKMALTKPLKRGQRINVPKRKPASRRSSKILTP